MEQFKNKCCNHQGGSTTNPPITNFKPQGQLEPGKDPGNITQSCFVLNKLPNIETVKELAFELCNIQQAFDKCPQYYTKSNFDALINTITKALFHLYVKSSEISGESVNLQQEITYSELVELINTNSLNPGQEYKITDYTFTTTQKDTSSAHHDFDIIVVADTINTLNEQARACKKEGDSYFDNNDLAAWELKYSVYNNVNKYNWADETSGKGVIYYLKDEFNNEAGFDFKSALFTKSVQVSYDNNYNEIDPTLEECNEYLTFHGFRSETTDKSLTGDFYNISIQPQKKLPYIKLINSGNNIKINAGSAYIYASSNIELLDGINYISSSLGIIVNGSYNIVTNSYDCLISKSSMQNRIVECRDVKLGFENNANYLRGCQYLTAESRVSSLSIKNWLYCKIETECNNIQSSGFSLKYSTIGYSNQNVILKSSGNVYYKTIAPNTFDTSWNEPEEQFEFNQDNLDKLEIISKAPLMTYVD